jgi:D-sedoheptulose 7-phosphate isomerase
MNKEYIKESIQDHLDALQNLDLENIYNLIELMFNTLNNGGVIFWCGNGGSAAQASHLSAELVGGMFKDKIKPFKSICINNDISFITAWSNDCNFDDIFVRKMESISSSKDLLICLSTSGNSKNLVNVASYCNDKKIKIVSLTGNDGGLLKDKSDLNINILSDCTQRIQEMHILIGHILCASIEKKLK